MTHPRSDDLGHMMSWATGERITSGSQIPPSVETYYMTWGGRAVSMILIQLFLLIPKAIYNILNGLVVILFANFVFAYTKNPYRQTKENVDSNIVTLAFIYFGIWFFTPAFNDVLLWLTGSITYLWMNTLTLLFGLPYFRYYQFRRSGTEADCFWNRRHSVPVMIVLFVGFLLISCIAGCGCEATSCATLVALLLFFLFLIRDYREDRKKGPVFLIAGIIGYIAGTAVLLLAPGNFVRFNAVSESDNLIYNYAYHIARETYYSLRFLLIPLAIAAVLFVLARRGKRPTWKWTDRRTMDFEWLFYLIAFFSIYAMTFASGFATRIYQFPLTMLLVAAGISWSSIYQNNANLFVMDYIQKAMRIAIVLLMCVVLVETISGYMYFRQTGEPFDRSVAYYLLTDSGVLGGNGIQK